MKDYTKNEGKLGWDDTRDKSFTNEFYHWKADKKKCGSHYYYTASKKLHSI
jgi:hypothetical protein